MIPIEVNDTLDNVIRDLITKKRNCRRDRNTVEFPLLRDAVFYLQEYQHLCNVLGQVVLRSKNLKEEEEDVPASD